MDARGEVPARVAASGAAAAGPQWRTTRPRERHVGRIVAMALAVAVAGAAWYERGTLARVWRRSVAQPPPPIVAVLPLELSDAQPSERYFADGLTEDLITRLGQTQGLKVIGRSATRERRGAGGTAAA